jgi:hypothetical protein
LQAAAAKLPAATCHAAYRPQQTCVTLAGGKPASWTLAQQRLATLLNRLRIGDWMLRADGPALRLLVPASSRDRLLDPLHAEFWPD